MSKTHTMMIAVLLSSTMSLSAQEDSQPRSRIPDPKPYADLLKDDSGPAVKKAPSVETRPVPESKRVREKSPARPAAASAETPETIREIDRIFAEARMHLEEIEKESGGSEAEAQAVFDDFLAHITARIEGLKLKEAQKKPRAGETSVGNAGVVQAELSGQDRQGTVGSERESPEPGRGASAPTVSEDHLKQGKESTVRKTVRVEVPEKSSLIEEVDRVLNLKATPLRTNHTPLYFPASKVRDAMEKMEKFDEAMKAANEYLGEAMEALKAANAVLPEKKDSEAADSQPGAK